MSNKRNKERIKIILLDGSILTTGDIQERLNNLQSSTGPIDRQRIYRSRRHDTVSMNQLGNLMRSLATKQGFCPETKQVLWKIKEVKKDVMDREIQAE